MNGMFQTTKRRTTHRSDPSRLIDEGHTLPVNGSSATTKLKRRKRKRQSRGHVFLLLLIFCLFVLYIVRSFRSHMQWSNTFNVVHVVQTRFMQQQPRLKMLAEARLKLFLSFTLPSLMNQTSREFLWIVRTDPDLEESIKAQLLRAVAPFRGNIVIVASNENPEGFRPASCVQDITKSTVWTGNYQLVQAYHGAAQTRAVLETRLDADDALMVDFVRTVQTLAEHAVPESGFLVWCVAQHIEWQYTSPWQNFTSVRGALVGVQQKSCITPGLTWAYGPNASKSNVSIPGNHAKLHLNLPVCNDTLDANCLDRLEFESKVPMALRARTPTSAGMERVFTKPDKLLEQAKSKYMQDPLWEQLPALFGVNAGQIWATRTWIHDNLLQILTDALEGQCTKGHSCKKESKKLIEELMDMQAD